MFSIVTRFYNDGYRINSLFDKDIIAIDSHSKNTKYLLSWNLFLEGETSLASLWEITEGQGGIF